MLPLKGTRILDLTTLSGYCGMELADYGAEVIKVESPNGGDGLRMLEPMKNGVSPHQMFRDRGKKSITLDIWKAEGQKLFKELVLTSDAVIENFPIGTLEELGLGYEDISKLKPSIIYGRISAYGSTGDGASLPQSEIVAQAKGGGMHVTGFPENPPTRIGFSIAEHYTASFLSAGICMALYNARATGEGQLVETSLVGTIAAITEDKVINYGATDVDPMRTGNAHPMINPYDILKCKNGYVAMGISSDDQWIKFCKAFNRVEWTEIEKYATNAKRGYHYFGDLRVKIEEMFAEYTMQEISSICDEVLIPGTMCSTTKEALEEPQLYERNMIVTVENDTIGKLNMPGRPVKFVGMEEEAFGVAPTLGEHNEEVYKTLNLVSAKLEQLKNEGVI